MLRQKVQYFLESAIRYNEPLACPSCGHKEVRLVDRKLLVTRLFECNNCFLYYRHPTESTQSNFKFYQKKYEESDDLTTYLPSDEKLEALKTNHFETSANRSANRLLGMFKAIVPDLEGVKIVDYGCSWGYISYQLQEAGMDVQSFELSEPRANFGNEKLNLKISTSLENLTGDNDIFFSSHVIEHVPSVSEMLAIGKGLLKKGGYFIAICPNGSPEYRQKNGYFFHHGWGKLHPNYLNAKFFQKSFNGYPFYIGSSPFDFSGIKNWNQQSQVIGNLEGGEIFIIAKIT